MSVFFYPNDSTLDNSTFNANWTLHFVVPRKLCPTCEFIKSGEAQKKGIQCLLHMCPDYGKYYCICDGTSPMTHEEKIIEWGSDPDDYKPMNGSSNQ